MANLFISGILVGAALVGPLQNACKHAAEAQKQRLETLVRSLADKDPGTRKAAAKDLAKIGPGANDAVPFLVKGLKDVDVDVRREVVDALGAIGPGAKDAIPDLIQILKDEKRRQELLQSGLIASSQITLAEIGPSVVPFLTREIRAKKVDPNFCEYATSILASLGCQAVSAVPALIKLLDHENPDIRRRSADALAWILASPENGRKNQHTEEGKKIQRSAEFQGGKQMAVAALVQALGNDPDYSVRIAASSALAMQKAIAAIPALVERMEKEPPIPALAFAAHLGSIGPEALPAILTIIEDEDRTAGLRSKAFHAFHVMSIPYTDRVPLNKESAKKAIRVFRKSLKDQDKDLRSDAALSLEEIGANAREAIPDLTAALKDPSVHVRLSAARAIYAIDPKNLSSLPVLIELMDDKSVGGSAIQAIRLLKDKAAPAVPKLIGALRNPDVQTRRVAISALGDIGPAAQDAIPYLEELVKTDEELGKDAKYSLERIKKLC